MSKKGEVPAEPPATHREVIVEYSSPSIFELASLAANVLGSGAAPSAKSNLVGSSVAQAVHIAMHLWASSFQKLKEIETSGNNGALNDEYVRKLFDRYPDSVDGYVPLNKFLNATQSFGVGSKIDIRRERFWQFLRHDLRWMAWLETSARQELKHSSDLPESRSTADESPIFLATGLAISSNHLFLSSQVFSSFPPVSDTDFEKQKEPFRGKGVPDRASDSVDWYMWLHEHFGSSGVLVGGLGF